MLRLFFTIIYFVVMLCVLKEIFSNTLSFVADLLAVISCIVALVVSVGCADYTVKKIEQKYSQK